MSAEVSPALEREQRFTRMRLNTRNRRQTREMKEKLQMLRAELERLARETTDEGTRRHARLIIDQVVTQLERIEDEDERTQNEERALIELEARRETRRLGR